MAGSKIWFNNALRTEGCPDHVRGLVKEWIRIGAIAYGNIEVIGDWLEEGRGGDRDDPTNCR